MLVRQESNLQGFSTSDLQSDPLPPTELLTNIEEKVRLELTSRIPPTRQFSRLLPYQLGYSSFSGKQCNRNTPVLTGNPFSNP